MSKRNTSLITQNGRTEAANSEWVLLDRPGGEVIKRSEEQEIKYEPIFNADGQTFKEWRSDLRRRQMEETFGGLSEFATNGLGFILLGLLKAVVVIVTIPWHLLSASCQSRPSSYQPGFAPTSAPRSNVNVDVEVNGLADVNVSVKVNNK